MPDTLLTLDVGNTRIKCGLFSTGDDRGPVPLQLTAVVRTTTADDLAQIRKWVANHPADARPRQAIIAGSHPEAREELVAAWPVTDVPLQVIDSATQVPVRLDVDVPRQVGLDRVLNALAVARRDPQTAAWVVVDSGTATTIDLVTHPAVFRGGSILPGIRLSARALHDYTARLPLLDWDRLPDQVPDLPARNTVDAMQAGLLWGHLGAVREVVGQLLQVVATENPGAEARVVLTGGGGRFLHTRIPSADYVDCLALHALAELASGNADAGAGRT